MTLIIIIHLKFQMSVGEKAVLDITSDYGYGPRGAGGVYPF